MVDFKSLQKLKKFINKYNLLEKDDKVLIAFSGGPDSVFLFHCLYLLRDEYNLELHLAYINHNLRKDVDKDIEFVKEFSKKYNTKLYIESANIKQIALDKKISEEEAGREERYRIFSHIVKENNLNKIATGHNLDDNVETFIFRLIRGTSLNGLKGIPVKRKNIIRPILEFRKDKIIDFLEKHNEEYRIDTTNLESKYTRNKIRNLIFPLFNDINPLFREKIIDLIKEINTLEVKENSDRELMIKNLLDLNEYEQNEKIFNLVSQYDIDINREKIRQIRKLIYSNGNKEINLGNSFILYKNYDKLKVITKTFSEFLVITFSLS